MAVIYSAEVVEASATRERRVKVTNRLTGEKYYRPFIKRSDSPEDHERGLRDKVRDIHTSPFLSVSPLWYDKALEMYFFEVTRRT